MVSRPISCEACGTLLLGEDPEPRRHQVTELPRIEPEVVEYQLHCLRCQACGEQTRGQWPAEMPTGRLQAVTGYLSGRFGVSRRDTQELLATLFRVEVGLGYSGTRTTPQPGAGPTREAAQTASIASG